MSQREFTKVSPQVWRSRRFRLLNSDARLLHLYFITCDHQTSAGCFRLPDAYAAADLGWEAGRYIAAREEVIGAGLIQHDPATEEVFVRGWFQVSPPMNAKHGAGIKAVIDRIESDALRGAVEQEYGTVRR